MFFNRLSFLSFVVLLVMACGPSEAQQSSDQITTASGYTPEINPNPGAPVQIVKFSDYQCPACKFFVPIEQKIKEDYGDQVSIVTKHFPLSMHPYAHVASRSAEAARKQGKYKEMHDKIFEGQEVWSKGNAERLFIGYAEEIGLDTEVFTADMNSAEMNQIVMEQRKEGVRMGVNATPTFYINGIKVENNPQTYMGFKVLIDRELD
jgi:protein-disulfide isomerase